jgi:dTDP-4-dehydrorhamnose reductase
MKVLVTGVKGQLGYDVMKELAKRKIEAVGVDIEDMDITDPVAVERVITTKNVDAVIHCAAYTAVDAAEDQQELCRKVNAVGTRNIARVCKNIDAKMLYISTDYVFDGQGERPWEPNDPKAPLNFYGQTKYEGELAVQEFLERYFIVRISWVFGVNGKNFVKTMLRLGKERGAVGVVADQVGSPTFTPDLAVLLVDMITTEKYGVYHATNEGYCSWYEFACEIFKTAGMDQVKVSPLTTDAFPVKAKRPANSRMDKTALDQAGFKRLPTWQDALKRYIPVLRETGEL